MQNRKPEPCHCDAYPFPHRTHGGKCREWYPVLWPHEASGAHYCNDDEAALFDRTEARAINTERDRLYAKW